MHKYIKTGLFLLCLSITACSQDIVLKQGTSVNMKFDSSTIVNPSKGIVTEKPIIYLMAGFLEKKEQVEQFSFSITNQDKENKKCDCKLFYTSNKVNKQNLIVTDSIMNFLELMTIHFNADTVNCLIELKNSQGENFKYPLKYEKPPNPEGNKVEEGILNKFKNNAFELLGLLSLLAGVFFFWKSRQKPKNKEKTFVEKEIERQKLKESTQLQLLNYLLKEESDTTDKSLKTTNKTSAKTPITSTNDISDKKLKNTSGKNLKETAMSETRKKTDNTSKQISEEDAKVIYSPDIKEKIKVLREKYNVKKVKEAYELEKSILEKKYKTELEEKEELNIQLEEVQATLIASEKAAALGTYPLYYLKFNNALAAIFEDLEKAKNSLDVKSPFNELFAKILKFDNSNAVHPLLRFAYRDNYIKESLKLPPETSINTITPEAFFDKFILWNCGKLINNLSKLYAYANNTSNEPKSLNLKAILLNDGVAVEFIKSAFNKLSILLGEEFNRSIQIPALEQPFTDLELVEKVDYCFVKSKFFDKLHHLDSNIVYDFNKVILLNEDTGEIVQKGQVSIKV